MGNRGGGAVRADQKGRMKEARHGTKHFMTWHPARPVRYAPKWMKQVRRAG